MLIVTQMIYLITSLLVATGTYDIVVKKGEQTKKILNAIKSIVVKSISIATETVVPGDVTEHKIIADFGDYVIARPISVGDPFTATMTFSDGTTKVMEWRKKSNSYRPILLRKKDKSIVKEKL